MSRKEKVEPMKINGVDEYRGCYYAVYEEILFKWA